MNDPLREALAALDLLLDGVDFRGLPRNSGWRVARRAANNARAALATKPAETPTKPNALIHTGHEFNPECPGCLTEDQIYDAGYDDAVMTFRGHPTESAGESPEAADDEPIVHKLRRALEVIAVGDSADPVRDAGDELVALGIWRAEALEQHRAETQRSSNATRSDEQTSPSVQPPAPEPRAWLYRFHTDDSLAGKPNVRPWIPTLTKPPDDSSEIEVVPLYAGPSIAQRGDK